MLKAFESYHPRHSMYGIFTYIGVVWGVNVGIYGILHGVFGVGSLSYLSVRCEKSDPFARKSCFSLLVPLDFAHPVEGHKGTLTLTQPLVTKS